VTVTAMIMIVMVGDRAGGSKESEGSKRGFKR
jgi:hypothetical protein